VVLSRADDASSKIETTRVLLLSADASAVFLDNVLIAPDKSSMVVSTDKLYEHWVREEALAGITSVDFVDTAAAVGKAVDHHTPFYTDRLKLHWEEVKSSFASGLTLLSGECCYWY
jgi:hypothetical protein